MDTESTLPDQGDDQDGELGARTPDADAKVRNVRTNRLTYIALCNVILRMEYVICVGDASIGGAEPRVRQVQVARLGGVD